MKQGVKLLALLLLLSLTGCWDRTELNELSITSATAIDRKDDRWIVSYQVLIPSVVSGAMGMKGGAQLPITVYSTEGPTIRETIYQSTLESPRTLFFSHNRVVIIGEELAKSGGLEELIDVYFRNSDSRETVAVLITKGEGRRILEQLMQIQIIPGDGIRETIRTERKDFSALPFINMYKLAMEMTSEAKNAVIPEIYISGGAPVTSADQMNKTTMTSKLKLGRLAVLREGRLAGWLEIKQALGANFLRNQVKSTVMSLGCGKGESSKESAIKIINASTRVKPVLQGEGEPIRMKVDIKAEGTLLETNCKADLDKPDTIKGIEKQLEGEISEVVRNGFEETQKLKADIVGFADLIHRKHPKQWKKMKADWPERYSQIQLETKVDFTLKRLGLTSKSFKKMIEEGDDS
ncbi:Ger(x)C family spore germination protein [Cohnella sp. AR92]|uniref:Ger(x)C family spore germination protein n=1 Tax=Cohnella sp. AR92 TaxID=648716 RepID=UPI0013155989|nr:Ger(x)C family spore germination protein [Cohnella sp. AR92]